MSNEIITDVLVIGGGGAGLRAALAAADNGCKVVLALKDRISRSGITPLASDGIAAPVNDDDTCDDYYEDSYKAGLGLADRDFIAALTGDARDRIQELDAKYGLGFKKEEDGRFFHPVKNNMRRDGYSCSINGGGFMLGKALGRAAVAHPGIDVREDFFALKLIQDGNKVCGAIFLDKAAQKTVLVKAKAVVLATGGYEELWSYTDTSLDSTGDGLALAYDCGAKLVDLELVQFYPTVIVGPTFAHGNFVPYDIFSENLLGAVVRNGAEEPFCELPCPQNEFVRKCYLEIKYGAPTAHGGYYYQADPKLDLEARRQAAERRMGGRYTHLLKMGVDLAEDRVEMAPSVHYCFGGIDIDVNCATCVPGLFAAGECSGNVHGAGRLFSNALTETQVFGFRAGQSAAKEAARAQLADEAVYAEAWAQQQTEVEQLLHKPAASTPLQIKQQLQDIMWCLCGPVRDGDSLAEGAKQLAELSQKAEAELGLAKDGRVLYKVTEAYEAFAMIKIARALLISAAQRQESRGVHYRSDFPEQGSPEHQLVSLCDGAPSCERRPVKM